MSQKKPATASAPENYREKAKASFEAKELYSSSEMVPQGGGAGGCGTQSMLGYMYHEGLGVAKDYREAVKWYRKAAEQGDAGAQTNLGAVYKFGGQGVPQNYHEAVRWYRKAAEQGVAVAQDNLGVMYAGGWGVAQDYQVAFNWFRKAAEQGYAGGQYNLGCCI